MLMRLSVLALAVLGCGVPVASITPSQPNVSPTTRPTVTLAASPAGTQTSSSAAPASSHGCGQLPPSIAPPIPSAGCVAPPLELPGPGQTAPPGRYTKSSFTPSIAFTVGEGWTATQATTGFFDIQDEPGSPDVVAIQFANVAADSVADAVAEIKGRDDIVISAEGTPTIDGHEGVLLTVQTLDPPDTNPPVFRPVLTVTPSPISIASGRVLQVVLLEVGGDVLAILVGGSTAEWDRAKELSDPVIRSVTIDG